jgi:hypothetical protein
MAVCDPLQPAVHRYPLTTEAFKLRNLPLLHDDSLTYELEFLRVEGSPLRNHPLVRKFTITPVMPLSRSCAVSDLRGGLLNASPGFNCSGLIGGRRVARLFGLVLLLARFAEI